MSPAILSRDERPDELVLQTYRQSKFDWSKYAPFLEQLCGDREYQKEAIRRATTFFLGNAYKNTKELAEENYALNQRIRDFHQSKQGYLDQFEFPEKLTCTLDLATGTGKSWTMYGVAQIMLCEGAVDYVLVLVPSTTIEKQLKQKFKDFASDSSLKKTLPKASKYKNPRVTSADVTLLPGDICVENDDAILEHVKSSSIIPSLKGQGLRTLIINDEAHHLISDEKHITKWNAFVSNPEFNFKYILNSTGTPFKNNNYFRDVIFRYSIRRAIDDCYVKDIRYLTESGSKDKLSLVYEIHSNNKKEYPEIKKPLTIFVAGKVDAAVKAAEEFKEFLLRKGFTKDEVDKQILIVSSRADHAANVERLDLVDNPESPVQWIFSVSMLSEGWDVKNVFQIVPHEERAFNSKLLVSQVLGRGLRIPSKYTGLKDKQPVVTITNHDAWSRNIESYVDAIAEINRLASYPVNKKTDYNFDIYWADATKEIKSSTRKVSTGTPALPQTLGFKHQIATREASFKEVKIGRIEEVAYDIELFAQSIGDVAAQIHTRLKDYDRTHNTKFSSRMSIDLLKELIKKELKRAGVTNLMSVSEENRQRALHAFDSLFRGEVGVSTIKIKYTNPQRKNTAEIQKVYVSTRSMDEHRAIVYDEPSVLASEINDVTAIQEFNQNPHRHHGAVITVQDSKNFKCPQNIVHARQVSEIKFVKALVTPQNAENLDAWVKLPDQGFYEIEYTYRPGTHSLTRFFNPDFIIKKGKQVIVVEIKQDDDTNEQNVAKCKYAEQYFRELNEKLKGKQEYVFTFLSPEDYVPFFNFLKTDKPKQFVSTLQADLIQKSKNRNHHNP